MPQQLKDTARAFQRAVLVTLQLPHQTMAEVQSSADELVALAKGLGIRVEHTVHQRRASGNTAQLLGEGKVQELTALVAPEYPEGAEPDPETEIDLVLVDTELSPGQQRFLERTLGVEVWDRTEVILEVFEQRARTQEAQLQVKIARIRYELPRLRDTQTGGDRQGGGGRGGRGHTNVELAKQRHRELLIQLQRELKQEQGRASAARAGRQHARRVALVGYTNAGKSSWMRALTGSDVQVENKLFATLGTTVRILQPETTPRVLVSDTVGFIDHLPHELIASFQSTLDEAREASLLLITVDASDSNWRKHLKVTRETLEQIGAQEVPHQLLFNKIDRLTQEECAALSEEQPAALFASSRSASDVARVRSALIEFFDQPRVDGELFVPFEQGALLGEIFAQARVVSQRHIEQGTVLTLRVDAEQLERWQARLPPVPPEAALPEQSVQEQSVPAEAAADV